MKIINANNGLSDQAIKSIINTLTSGGLIIYPTETCYGLGADAANLKAVDKLWAFKGGRGKKAVSIMVNNESMAGEYVDINDTAKHLYEQFLPGPITVISKSKGKVVNKIESERNTLGVRIPDHPTPLAIAKAYGKPITATSANPSGKKSPYSLADWQKYTSQSKQAMIDIFIDAGQLPYNDPSTVVDTTLSTLDIVRPGSIYVDNSKQVTHTSHTVEETYQIAANFVQNALVQKVESKPIILTLSGELGSGKTHFTQGLAKALGIKEQVVSPTYQVMREYDYTLPVISTTRAKARDGEIPLEKTSNCGKLSGKVTKNSGKPSGKLVHIDTWRLHSPEEINDFGVSEYETPGNLIVIEWPEKINEWIQSQNTLTYYISFSGLGEDTRYISIAK